jgi:hypothetical protein
MISFTIFPLLWGRYGLILPNRPTRLVGYQPAEVRAWAVYVLGSAAMLWLFFQRASGNRRGLNLLRNGETALGRVVGPVVGSFSTPKITYEFRDSKGHFVSGAGADIQGTLEEDAYILVFYDSQRPENCIALCTTDYELAKC